MPATGGAARAPDLPLGLRAPLFLHARRQGASSSARPAVDPASNRLFPTGSQPELYSVPAAGGRAVQVLATPAEDARLSRDGSFLIYHDRKGGENEWRKHHTSAIARDIWVYDTQTGQHRTDHRIRRRGPQPRLHPRREGLLLPQRGERLVQRPPPGDRRRRLDPGHQFSKTHPVRFLSLADDGTLCFGYDGAIYTMREAAGAAAAPRPRLALRPTPGPTTRSSCRSAAAPASSRSRRTARRSRSSSAAASSPRTSTAA